MHRPFLFLKPYAVGVALLSIVVFAHAPRSTAKPQSQLTLHGTVRDAHGKPLAGVKVLLQSKEAGEIAKTVTGDQGTYSFSIPTAGNYTIDASREGYNSAKAGPISVGRSQSNIVNLTLNRLQESPGFYDPPQFTVSGVTDTTNLGGHGSDTIVRTRDALAKATSGLSSNAKDASASGPSEQSLREAVKHEPDNGDVNRRLAELLIEENKAAEAIPYAEHAVQLQPQDFSARFDLAVANANAANYERAKQQTNDLLQKHENAEAHHLLAVLDEKTGAPLDAVRHYQKAAELNPREPYLFDWGAELLLHHAPAPALDVFRRGSNLFPNSTRMLVGSGASLFALGEYEQAVDAVCHASDLVPADSTPYRFLGKMDRVPSVLSQDLAEHLKRFAQANPENSEANYYYAAALWKRRKNALDPELAQRVESLLRKALQNDPKFAAAYLQLGIVHSEERNFLAAIADLQQAIQSDPNQPESHFRLAQAYRQADQADKARSEIEIYDRLSKASAAEADRERHEIQQFVYTLRDQTKTKAQQ